MTFSSCEDGSGRLVPGFVPARGPALARVTRWARKEDGPVEVVVEGEPDAAAALEAWCHDGPPLAVVSSVEVQDELTEGLTAFHIPDAISFTEHRAGSGKMFSLAALCS